MRICFSLPAFWGRSSNLRIPFSYKTDSPRLWTRSTHKYTRSMLSILIIFTEILFFKNHQLCVVCIMNVGIMFCGHLFTIFRGRYRYICVCDYTYIDRERYSTLEQLNLSGAKKKPQLYGLPATFLHDRGDEKSFQITIKI